LGVHDIKPAQTIDPNSVRMIDSIVDTLCNSIGVRNAAQRIL
jgi:hypothetical protein